MGVSVDSCVFNGCNYTFNWIVEDVLSHTTVCLTMCIVLVSISYVIRSQFFFFFFSVGSNYSSFLRELPLESELKIQLLMILLSQVPFPYSLSLGPSTNTFIQIGSYKIITHSSPSSLFPQFSFFRVHVHYWDGWLEGRFFVYCRSSSYSVKWYFL